MDDDTTRRGPHNDDPEATSAMWPLPDGDQGDVADDESAGRSAESRAHSAAPQRGAPAPFERTPDQESTSVLSASAAAHGGDPTRVAPDGGRDWLDQPLPATPTPVRARAGRPRLRRSGPAWPRIVAPIVLLAAVVAVVTLSVHAGVLGGAKSSATHPTASTSPAATTAKKHHFYRVRKGDTMSTIAAKYNISLSELLLLNPRASSSTLAIGQKLRVPAKP
jgi:LysM repeat protein